MHNAQEHVTFLARSLNRAPAQSLWGELNSHSRRTGQSRFAALLPMSIRGVIVPMSGSRHNRRSMGNGYDSSEGGDRTRDLLVMSQMSCRYSTSLEQPRATVRPRCLAISQQPVRMPLLRLFPTALGCVKLPAQNNQRFPIYMMSAVAGTRGVDRTPLKDLGVPDGMMRLWELHPPILWLSLITTSTLQAADRNTDTGGKVYQ